MPGFFRFMVLLDQFAQLNSAMSDEINEFNSTPTKIARDSPVEIPQETVRACILPAAAIADGASRNDALTLKRTRSPTVRSKSCRQARMFRSSNRSDERVGEHR
jgi:hypothetical protein